MEEITTPHFWSALNYNFLPAILTQEINYTKIILLHILEAGACFIKSISPAFSLGHISRCGKKIIVFSFSLPRLSWPPLFLFALPTHVLLLVLSHSCFFPLLVSLSLLLIFTSLLSLSPFFYPFSCLNYLLWTFCCIVWKWDANNKFAVNSRSIRAHKSNCIG